MKHRIFLKSYFLIFLLPILLACSQKLLPNGLPEYTETCKLPQNMVLGANTSSVHQKWIGIYSGIWDTPRGVREGIPVTLIIQDINGSGEVAGFSSIGDFYFSGRRRTIDIKKSCRPLKDSQIAGKFLVVPLTSLSISCEIKGKALQCDRPLISGATVSGTLELIPHTFKVAKK